MTLTMSVHYPDGTKGPTPKDGQRFVSVLGDNWEWDATMVAWVRGYGGSHSLVKPGDIERFEAKLEEMVQCQCGKEKHGFASHAQWCDIWKKENKS